MSELSIVGYTTAIILVITAWAFLFAKVLEDVRTALLRIADALEKRP